MSIFAGRPRSLNPAMLGPAPPDPPQSIPYAGANWRAVEIEINGLPVEYRVEWRPDGALDDAWTVHLQIPATSWDAREKRARAVNFARQRQDEINARRPRGPVRYRADGSYVDDDPRPSFDFSPAVSPEAEAERLAYALGVEGIAVATPPDHFGPCEIEAFAHGLAAGRQAFEDEELARRAEQEADVPHDPLAFVDHAELVEFAGTEFASKIGGTN